MRPGETESASASVDATGPTTDHAVMTDAASVPASPSPPVDASATSLALLTDLYQLTMAAAAWRLGRMDHEAVFHLTFRQNPFGGGHAIACGLEPVARFIESMRFTADDLTYLETLRGNDDRPLFEPGFLDELASMRPALDVDAVPEGTVVFPHEPILRVRGPLVHAQILETPILNIINFQTLLATKAARICQAAGGDPVLEFGLRRAQGIDGAVSASRAAYVGGCTHTSNVLAGKHYGIPVAGTHAHSWIMSFDDELEAFDAYAEAMPHNCTLLVDTYDTITGVHKAVEVGRRLAARGHRLAGIRLDSGDLAWLSQEARRILDEAGFEDARIVASNDLDEHVIGSLRQQNAAISVWGVGTRLATAYDQPAFGGVYKLGAVREPGGPWRDRVKISEQTAKVSVPGALGVRRYTRHGEPVADMVHDDRHPPAGEPPTIVDPLDVTRRRPLDDADGFTELLEPVFRRGERIADLPDVHAARRRTIEELGRFHPGIRRFVNPHAYPVGLESGLSERRTQLLIETRDRMRSDRRGSGGVDA